MGGRSLVAPILTILMITVPAAAELAGFPVPLGGSVFGPVVVADFNGDGKPEIAVAVDDVAAKGEPARGALQVVDGTGRSLSGWPVFLPEGLGGVQMAAGNLFAGSPGAELALGTSDGKLHLFTGQGTEAPGFPVNVGAYCTRCLIAALGGNKQSRLIGVSQSGLVTVCEADGKAAEGWPKTIAGGLAWDCEIADWDGAGGNDVLVLDKRGDLHVLDAGGTEQTRLPLGATAFGTGDFLPDRPGLEVLASSDAPGSVTLIDHDGQVAPGWPVAVPGASLPTAVRLSVGGPFQAVVVQAAQSKPEATQNVIHILQADGKPAPGWPVTAQFYPGYAFYSRPAVADVDGDGRNELIFGHTCYAVAGYRADGTGLGGFPIRDVGMVYATPALADLQGNRRYEVLFADVSSVKSLHAFPLPFEYTAQPKHVATEAEKARGFVLSAAAPFETILPDAPALEAQKLDRLELTACAGEFEPATFVLHALREVAVELRPGDLASDGGRRIAAASLDLRFVHVWRQRKPEGPGEYLVPELLLKRDPGELKGIISQPLTPEAHTRVPAGTARQFWVTVRVPENARPGVYAGRLSLIVEGAAHEVPCRLRVLPLRLPPDPFVHGIYFHGSSMGLGWYGEKTMSREAFLTRAREQLADLRAHGINATETYAPVAITTKGDGYLFDLANLRQAMKLHQEAGLTRWIVASLGYSALDGQQLHPRLGPAFYRAFTALVAAVEKLRREENLPPLLHYGVDEPMRKTAEEAMKYYGFADPIEVCRQWFGAIRAGGGYSTAAVYRSEVGGWAVLGPLCDVPIFSLGSVYPSATRDAVAAEVTQRRSREAWYYWQCWTENPMENRLLAGLYLCKSGLTGVMPWAYMAYNGDPYQDDDEGAKDMCVAYPSQEGPIPTLAWEAFREGVDDCRYYAAVRDRPEAQRVLDELSFSASQNETALRPEDLQRLRMRLAACAGG